VPPAEENPPDNDNMQSIPMASELAAQLQKVK
jgi:hypothetical protein